MLCAHCGGEVDELTGLCTSCGAKAELERLADWGPEAKTYVSLSPSDVLEGKWRIQSRLGSGGTATVLLAFDLELKYKVAIKVMHPKVCNEPDMIARFLREARVMARLDHPHIVPIYAVGRHGERPFIVMKHLDGTTLSAHLRTRPKGVTLAEGLAIMKPLCSGLGFIHSQGMVHRDIKAGNIFISPSRHVTILDLGLAREVKSTGITQAGWSVGTPQYMSPEQILGSPNVDARSDIYSLGVVLYELTTGRLPYDGESDLSIVERHLNKPMPDPSAFAPVPKAVAAAMRRCLAKEPRDRFQSTRELLSALEAAVAPERTGRPLGSDNGAPTDPEKTPYRGTDVIGVIPTTDINLRATVPELMAPPSPTLGLEGSTDAAIRLALRPSRRVPIVLGLATVAALSAAAGILLLRRGAPPVLAPPAQTSTLIADATPSMQVWIDGVLQGLSPVRTQLPAGDHVLIFKDDHLNLNQIRRLHLRPGEDRQEQWRPGKGKVLFRVTPAAQVFLAQRSLGPTASKPVELYEGHYQFKLVSADGRSAVREVDIRAGEQTLVKVDLAAQN